MEKSRGRKLRKKLYLEASGKKFREGRKEHLLKEKL